VEELSPTPIKLKWKYRCWKIHGGHKAKGDDQGRGTRKKLTGEAKRVATAKQVQKVMVLRADGTRRMIVP
jgi:hypothetical protein